MVPGEAGENRCGLLYRFVGSTDRRTDPPLESYPQSKKFYMAPVYDAILCHYYAHLIPLVYAMWGAWDVDHEFSLTRRLFPLPRMYTPPSDLGIAMRAELGRNCLGLEGHVVRDLSGVVEGGWVVFRALLTNLAMRATMRSKRPMASTKAKPRMA